MPAVTSHEGDGRFGQVARDPSLADKVTTTITQAIVSGQLEPGERLDSERDLAEQFGVSRTVVREAVRSLMAQGLVEARAGRGVEVRAIGGDAVTRSMSLYLRSNPSIDYTQVHEVRSALEIQITGLAAERATEEQLERLAHLNEQLASIGSDQGSAAKLDVEFHRTLAVATQNPLFAVLLDSIGDVLLEIRQAAFAAPDMLEYAAQAHELILAGVKQRDPAAARDAMRKHLDESKQVWLGLQDGPEPA